MTSVYENWYVLQLSVFRSVLFALCGFKLLWLTIYSRLGHRAYREPELLLFTAADGWLLFHLGMIHEPLRLRMSLPEKLPALTVVPGWIWWCYGILSLFIVIRSRRKLDRWRREHLTRDSVKSALDDLPMGVCFIQENGRVLLTNRKMLELAKRIQGEPLFNGLRFLDCLREPEGNGWSLTPPGGEDARIETKNNQRVLYHESGEAWSFRRTMTKNGESMVTAADLTEQVRLTKTLTAENRRLLRMNHRMKQYGLQVEELTRQEELLGAQIRVHDELGHVLLASRLFLEPDEHMIRREDLKELWEHLLLSLKHYPETTTGEAGLKELTGAAESLGLRLTVIGQVPEDPTARHLLAAGARECLTNGARAGAGELRIVIREQMEPCRKVLVMEFTNDGAVPEEPIREGVGLGTLRQITEREGASMETEWEPRFCLRLQVPLEVL